MGTRLLIRTKAGDHVATSEAEVLQWLKDGHCECGDPVYLEAESKWVTVSDLQSVAPLFQEKPKSKREKPVITIYRLGTGKSLQDGPFTLSAVLEMIAQGTLSSNSWIYVEGDTEWRQVKAVKILRQALPELPAAAPDFENIGGAIGKAAPLGVITSSAADSLLGGISNLADEEPTPPGGTPTPRMREEQKTSEILGFNDSSKESTSFVPIPHDSPQVMTRTHSVRVDEDELIPDGETAVQLDAEDAPTVPTSVIPDAMEIPAGPPGAPPNAPEMQAVPEAPGVLTNEAAPTFASPFPEIPHDSPQVETAAHTTIPETPPTPEPPQVFETQSVPEVPPAPGVQEFSDVPPPPDIPTESTEEDSSSIELTADAFKPASKEAVQSAYDEAMAEDDEVSVRLDNTGMNFNIPKEMQSEEGFEDNSNNVPVADDPVVTESPANMVEGGTKTNLETLASQGFISIPGEGEGPTGNTPQQSAPPPPEAVPMASTEIPQATGGAPAPPPPPVTESLAVDNSDDGVDHIPREEQTMALSVLGLSSMGEGEAPASSEVPVPPAVSTPPVPPTPAPPTANPGTPPQSPVSGSEVASEKTVKEDFDGITVEISPEPIWQVKQDGEGRLSGPFTFQEVLDLLQSGRLSKEDKISKLGSNRFSKISQQYEFNVKHSVETVIENGVEKQKILIKRRHPRVAYMTDAQINFHGQSSHAKCVNISAGGVLLEANDLDVKLGDQVELILMPGAITSQIQSTALVIGKIPKKPPGFALKFVNLAVEDKEAIQFYVMEALKREKAMGM